MRFSPSYLSSMVLGVCLAATPPASTNTTPLGPPHSTVPDKSTTTPKKAVKALLPISVPKPIGKAVGMHIGTVFNGTFISPCYRIYWARNVFLTTFLRLGQGQTAPYMHYKNGIIGLELGLYTLSLSPQRLSLNLLGGVFLQARQYQYKAHQQASTKKHTHHFNQAAFLGVELECLVGDRFKASIGCSPTLVCLGRNAPQYETKVSGGIMWGLQGEN